MFYFVKCYFYFNTMLREFFRKFSISEIIAATT